MGENHSEMAKLVQEELKHTLEKDFKLIDEMLEFSLRILRRCEKSERAKSNQYSFRISLIMFSRAYNSALAMYELVKSGFSFHAGMICRSLFDDLVNLKYLNLDNCEEKANRYIDFRKMRKVRFIKRYQGLKGKEDISQELKQHLEITKQAFRAKYPNGKWDTDWSGISMKEKAEKVDLQNHYHVVSAQLSNYIHGGPEGMKGNIDGKYQLWIGPRTSLALEIMSILTQYLLLSVEEMIIKFGLEEEKSQIGEYFNWWKTRFTNTGRRE